MIAEQTMSILARAIDSENRPLTSEAAREVLQWRLSDDDNRRMDELLAKSRIDGFSPEEGEEFRELCAAVDLLSLLHVRAREALGDFNTPGA